MSVYRPRRKDGTFASPFFHYDFQFNGVRFHGSTGAKTERAAEDIERQRRLEAAEGADDTTISGAFHRFWTEVGEHQSDPKTTFGRLAALQDGLGNILGKLKKPLLLASITEDELARYVAARRVAKSRHGRPLAPATINREVQLLRRVMRRAVIVWKRKIALPDWKQVLLEEPEEHVVDVTPELEAAIAAKLRPEFAVVLRFLAMTGLREGSVLATPDGRGPLGPGAVDFETGILTVKMKSKKPGGRTLRLPITRAMKILLANEIGKHPKAIFTYAARRARKGHRRGEYLPVALGTFYHDFKAAAAACGHPEFRPHDLRHTAGNRILSTTGNLRLAQKQLGHTRITTTQRYTHPDVEALRAAMERVHSPEPRPEQATVGPAEKKTR